MNIHDIAVRLIAESPSADYTRGIIDFLVAYELDVKRAEAPKRLPANIVDRFDPSHERRQRLTEAEREALWQAKMEQMEYHWKISEVVTCTYCKAKPGQPCETRSGRIIRNCHGIRIAAYETHNHRLEVLGVTEMNEQKAMQLIEERNRAHERAIKAIEQPTLVTTNDDTDEYGNIRF